MAAKDTSIRGLRFAFVALLVVNLLFFGYVLLSFRFAMMYQRDYKVDEVAFARNVAFAVSNYLDAVSVSSRLDNDPGVSASESLNVEVRPVPGLGFYTSYSGVPAFVVDGVSYRAGDYCEYGFVLSVGSDRAYCRTTGGDYVVLRAKPNGVQSVSDAVPDEDGASRPLRDGNETEARL